MNSQTTILTEDKLLQRLHLPDGRLLSFAEYGDPIGKPLFFFHGGNDSRLEAAILDETAQTLGVRIIAPDRPGYGRSTFQPERTFLGWPEDVAQLADALAITRFAVAGHSGGGPHAAAVAYALPQRLTGVALISSPAPPGSRNQGMHPMFRIINFLMGSSPSLHRRMMQQTADQVRHTPDKFFAQWGKMSPADGRLFHSRPAIREMIAAEMAEAVHQGIDAILQEHPLYKRPWGFDLNAISVPVHIWHGLADPQAAPAWSRYLAAHIPQAMPHFIPDEGHFSIMANHQADILAGVVPGEHAA
jgi:pimeloyl-ACP methyl ester carboxylesterase